MKLLNEPGNTKSMSKYLQLFKISFAQEFVYRVNFVMWRVRNVLQIFVAFFLWSTVFSDSGKELFGYDKAKILTYVFGLILVRAFVLSSKSVDVAGDIANGDVLNYLLKPVSYFKYWFTRDFASKFLNISFAVLETVILYIILKPPFFIQTNILYLSGFLVSVILAMLIYFILLFATSCVPFWVPEMAWGAQFLVTVVILEFLSGALFPLDILPSYMQTFLSYTPFPYLIFFPLQVYLGKVDFAMLTKGVGVSFVWVILLWYLLQNIWKKGLKVYGAYGR